MDESLRAGQFASHDGLDLGCTFLGVCSAKRALTKRDKTAVRELRDPPTWADGRCHREERRSERPDRKPGIQRSQTHHLGSTMDRRRTRPFRERKPSKPPRVPRRHEPDVAIAVTTQGGAEVRQAAWIWRAIATNCSGMVVR